MEIKFNSEREFLEGMVDIFISSRQMNKAIDAVELLDKKFPLSGKTLLLRARIFELYDDYANVLRNGEAALARRDTSPKDTMMLHNLVAGVYDKLGESTRAAEHYLASSRVEFRAIDDQKLRAELLDDRREDYSNYLFALHRLPPSKITSEKIFSAVKHYDKLFSGVKRFRHNRPRARKKFRLGLISPDLRAHVAGEFAAAFFTHHDRDRFEVFGYAACKEDEFSALLRSNADGWQNILGDEPSVAARKIFDDELDALIDLSGHTSQNCLPIMAYKPARIQLSGVGWIGSTGLKAIDYFLVDRYTVPDHRGEKYFTERVLRLPRTHFCYRRPSVTPPSRPSPSEENNRITFGSFNNFSKVTDDQLRLWTRIMTGVPEARLLIKSTVFDSEFVQRATVERLRAASLDLERIVIEGGSPRAEYLERLRSVDILLDSFPYVGGGTTCDALYMGVPVISLIGDRHGSRFGLSFLSNVGAEELCASSEDEYVGKAIALAGDGERLERYHRTLSAAMESSPLMDAASYMADVEAALEKILSR